MKTLNRLLVLHLDTCDQFAGLAEQVNSLKTELDGEHRVVVQLQEKCAGLEASLRERTAAPAQADALAAIELLKSTGHTWTGSAWVMQQPCSQPVPSLPETCEPDLTAEPAVPPQPVGDGWRLFSTRPPRDKSAIVQASLFNGSFREAPARELDWNLTSVGVAWWRSPQ